MRLSDDDLRTPQMQIATNRIRGMVDLALEKVALHHRNPNSYPLPSDPRSVERALHNLFTKLPDRKQKKLLEKANETLKLNATKRAQHYGELKDISLRAASAIVDQVKALPPPAAFKFTPAEVARYTDRLKAVADQPKKAGQPKARQAVAQEISFVVDSLTCKKKTEVSKDEISLAGFAVDNAGTSLNVEPFFVSKFKKGETVSLGNKGKLFTFKQNVGTFPRTFTANIFLVESDLVHSDEVLRALIILAEAITIAGLIVATALVVAATLGAAIPVIVIWILLGVSIGSGLSSLNLIPWIADDISITVADSLTVLTPLAPGIAFDRTLEIKGLSSNILGTLPGEYTATGRWVAQ